MLVGVRGSVKVPMVVQSVPLVEIRRVQLVPVRVTRTQVGPVGVGMVWRSRSVAVPAVSRPAKANMLLPVATRSKRSRSSRSCWTTMPWNW